MSLQNHDSKRAIGYENRGRLYFSVAHKWMLKNSDIKSPKWWALLDVGVLTGDLEQIPNSLSEHSESESKQKSHYNPAMPFVLQSMFSGKENWMRTSQVLKCVLYRAFCYAEITFESLISWIWGIQIFREVATHIFNFWHSAILFAVSVKCSIESTEYSNLGRLQLF